MDLISADEHLRLSDMQTYDDDPLVVERFQWWLENNNYGYLGKRSHVPPSGWAQVVVWGVLISGTLFMSVGAFVALRWLLGVVR